MADARRRTAGGRRDEADRNDLRVLTAAGEVFTELGWDAPISAVARRAGVGMGSIYRRYPSKDALLRQICANATDRAALEARTALAEEPDGWSALRRFMRLMVEARTCSLFVFTGGTGEPGMLDEASGRMHQAIDAIIETARHDGLLRPEVTSTDVCVLLSYLRSVPVSEPDRQSELQERYLEIMLAGLRSPTATGSTEPPLPELAPDWTELDFGPPRPL
jgi:AcrR family transcriptional regulator